MAPAVGEHPIVGLDVLLGLGSDLVIDSANFINHHFDVIEHRLLQFSIQVICDCQSAYLLGHILLIGAVLIIQLFIYLL